MVKRIKRGNKSAPIVASKSSSVAVSKPVLLVDKFVIENPNGLGDTPTHETRYIGKYSGWGMAQFQNWVLAQCATEPHTDDDIGRIWEREHPCATAYQRVAGAVWYVKHDVRGLYNHGKHSQRGGPPVDTDGRWNPTPVWSDAGVPTYPAYPKRWTGSDGKPNGIGPPPRAE